jgi:arylsulfatase A-like enzyme
VTIGLWSLMAVGVGTLVIAATWERRAPESFPGPVGLGQRLAWLVALALWFGIVTGALHGLALVARQYSGQIVFYPRDLLWMSPAAFVLTNLVVAALAAPLALGVGRERFLRVTLGVFALVNTVLLLLAATEIARVAMLVLAAGGAIQLGRLGWRPGRRAWLFAAAVVVCIGIQSAVAIGWRAIAERNGLAAVLPRAETPNVLLVVLDTVRARNMSLYGHERPTTPALERWAETSAVFDLAIAASSWTLPSHAAMLSGEIGSASGGGWRHPVVLGGANLPERYRSLGYATGGFVANLHYTSYESGLTGAFLSYDDYRRTRFQLRHHSPLGQARLPESMREARSPRALLKGLLDFNLEDSRLPAYDVKPAPLITDAFLDWHGALGDRPFFALLNYFDAHWPYRAPPDYMNRFRRRGGALDRYDAAIAFLDSELDRLFRTLDSRGVLDKTIVIVTSDHGEGFGEPPHGVKTHGNGLYLPQIHVPLLIRYPPRVPAGARVPEAVSLVDLAATVLDLSGQPRRDVPGLSLVRAFEDSDDGSVRAPAISELLRDPWATPTQRNARTWLQSVVFERLHFIRDGEGREELYDLSIDPDETQNRAGVPQYGPQLETLRRFLATFKPPIED